MENVSTLINPDASINNCFSEAFITDSITRYLKENGYKVSKEHAAENGQKIITASTFFKKELVEIKGAPANYFVSAEKNALVKNAGALHQARQWFSEALFSSLINFGKYYQNENVTIAMALPNSPRYKTIITSLHDYFTLNDLYFKIYLINEDGAVEIYNLNENYLPKADKS